MNEDKYWNCSSYNVFLCLCEVDPLTAFSSVSSFFTEHVTCLRVSVSDELIHVELQHQLLKHQQIIYSTFPQKQGGWWSDLLFHGCWDIPTFDSQTDEMCSMLWIYWSLLICYQLAAPCQISTKLINRIQGLTNHMQVNRWFVLADRPSSNDDSAFY